MGASDGDTIKVMRDGREVKIRLDGIDCPERYQAYGTSAKKFTSDHAYGKTVTVVAKGLDRYGRTIGEVILPDGRNLNYELVRAGMAWWYRKHSDDPRLKVLESEARKANVGLWSRPDAIPPWEFRRR